PARKVLFTEHHQSHAAATFLAAPTRDAAILTADGVGEWATLSLGRGTVHEDGSTELRMLREIHFPHSLGMLYSTFTAWLGFPVNEGEYKVMGLASYGRPVFADEVRRVLRRTPDGGFSLDLSYFDYHLSARTSYSRKFVDVFGAPRDPWDAIDLESETGRHYADVACSVQRVLEDTLVDLARRLYQETGLSDLCLGGGVALNGCANARMLRESGFSRVLVPSAPGDAGCALGAALCADRIHFGNPALPVPTIPSGDRKRSRSSCLAWPPKTGSLPSGTATRRCSRAWPMRSAPDRSSRGSRENANSARARWATAASWPRRGTRRCATS
ncbi:MAG TPA: carbamoyltransferase N-terminal domain-containing protein, partial [Myxococcales bacterium]|nr:carbamoyltransferase N-terminal domain-containing protein [Myxococcales bacterium]